jgi:hypothetical protein
VKTSQTGATGTQAPPDVPGSAEPSAPLNRRAAKAWRRSWIPVVGIVLGRRALKEMRWTGERGRNTARRAIAVNAVVTALVAVEAVTGWVPGRSGSAGPSVLDLKGGQCYVDTEKHTLDPDAVGYVSMDIVRVVRCGTAHDGEVTGRWDAGTAWHAYPSQAGMKARAGTECARVDLAYAPDSWRLPGNAVVREYFPSEQGWTSGGRRHVVCVIGAATGRFTGSVRQDPAALDADQRAYLAAEDIGVLAGAARPDQVRVGDDPDGWTSYARATAAADRKETAALRARSWPSAAASPIADLAAAEAKAAAAWSRAAGDTTASSLADDVTTAQDLEDAAPSARARAALHLPTGGPALRSV